MSGPPRKGEVRTCEQCGTSFYATQSQIKRGARFCTQRCMGDERKRERICSVCGARWVNPDGHRSRTRTTCSDACERAAKARGKKGPLNPNWAEGGWLGARGERCVVCGTTHPLHLHHIISRQQLRRVDGNVSDPRNALTLCDRCHAQHHAKMPGIPLSVVLYHRPEVVAFAKELELTWWLSREYPRRSR